MPKGVFTGKKPEVSHLRIFKTVAYFHIPEEKRSKLERTVKVGYLVGYSEISKAYRIYIPSNGEIVVRRMQSSWKIEPSRNIVRCHFKNRMRIPL